MLTELNVRKCKRSDLFVTCLAGYKCVIYSMKYGKFVSPIYLAGLESYKYAGVLLRDFRFSRSELWRLLSFGI
jgi:hypothetical protein